MRRVPAPFSSLLLALAAAASTACGESTPPPRTPGGMMPEGQGVCVQEGKPLLLEKWPGGLCSQNPAEPKEGAPSCAELSEQLGCQSPH